MSFDFQFIQYKLILPTEKSAMLMSGYDEF